jgi:hypothetical protein
MGKHASPLLVAESGPGVEFTVATGAKTLTGVAGVAGVTGFFVVVVGAVAVAVAVVVVAGVVAVVVGAAGVVVVVVEVWPKAAVEPPAALALALADAALLAELLEPQPLSTNTKHAI